MKEIFKKVLIGMILFILCSISAEAAEIQLRVFLGEEGEQVKLSFYRIADIEENRYEWLDEYQGISVEFSGLSKAKEMQDASKAVYAWIQ